MTWVLGFAESGATDLARVGGKGANLGILARDGLPVPPGFCVTTEAFAAFVEGDATFAGHLAGLAGLSADDLEGTRRAGATVREHLLARPVPDPVAEAVLSAWGGQGDQHGYAVRSSATAEDLPTASFAGQQDTYLNIRGPDALIDAVRRCWASLFTDRAILYRAIHHIPHDQVALAVVVQQMIHPESSGILFTADPVTGHRGVTAIDAGFGLGEALVSGLISADRIRVRRSDGAMVEVAIGDKRLAIRSLPDGGTQSVPLSPEEAAAPVLTPEQIRELVDLGDQIAVLQGQPQDIEWCFADGELYVVQARPITSLYPLPEPRDDDGSLHVYFSFNHFQVMTDAMPPFALSLWSLLLPLGRRAHEVRPSPQFRTAGGRIYLDLSPLLRFGPTRRMLVGGLGIADRLVQASIRQVVARPEFARGPAIDRRMALRVMRTAGFRFARTLFFAEPEAMHGDVSAFLDAIAIEARDQIGGSGSTRERLARGRTLVAGLLPRMYTLIPQVVTGIVATRLIARAVAVDPSDLDALGRGLRGNVTTQMDLEVGDLADLARPHPELCSALQRDDDLDALSALPGGHEFVAGLRGFLDAYGCRGPGEIDVSRPRWADDPASILRAVAGNLAGGARAHRTHFDALVAAGDQAADRIADQARRGLLGWVRGPIVSRLLRLARHTPALREHPKFLLVRVFQQVRDAVIAAGGDLVAAGRIDRVEDAFLFEWEELERLLDEDGDLRSEVDQRRQTFERDCGRVPPRVMTSDGEIPTVDHDIADLPAGALGGTSASTGAVEGTARVVRDPNTEVLHKGEILVAPFTDPGWTPLFVNAAGLVMEVGGLMTHGSVVAREYGIPAVVCVPDATTRIRTGDRIRVDGDRGWVEILEDAS